MPAVFALGLLIILSCVFPQISAAAIYYISPNGSNTTGDGSASKPWASLSKACAAVRNPLDIIKVTTDTDNSPCDLAIGVSIEGAGRLVTSITTSAKGYYINAISSSFVKGNNTISGITFRGGTSIADRKGDGCIRFQRRHNSLVHDCDIKFFESPASSEGNAVEFLGEVNWEDENTNPPAVWMEGCKLYNCRITVCHRGYLYRAAVTVIGLSGLELYDDEFDETGTAGFCLKGSPGWLKGAKIHGNTFTVDPGRLDDMGSGAGFWPSHASATHDLSNIEWSYNEFIGMFGIGILIMDKPDDPVGPMCLKLNGQEISNNVFDGLVDFNEYSATATVHGTTPMSPARSAFLETSR